MQEWVGRLPWKLQSILFSGLRGPDVPNVPALKVVNRWMRTVCQFNADPSKDYMRLAAMPPEEMVCQELEFLPCHFVHHFADALAVIAVGHPEREVAMIATAFLLRHRDKPGGVDPGAAEWKRWSSGAQGAFYASVHEARKALDGECRRLRPEMEDFLSDPMVQQIAVVLNKFPEVKWDRLTRSNSDYRSGAETVWIATCFGWIAREDGRSDFLVIELSRYGTDELWPTFTTSSAELSEEFNRRLWGDEVGHNECERVEDVFGPMVTNRVKLDPFPPPQG